MTEDTYYLTTDKHPREKGKLVAVISRGHPQCGDKTVVVCDVTTVNNRHEAKEWYKRQMELLPWLTDVERALEEAKRAIGETKH